MRFLMRNTGLFISAGIGGQNDEKDWKTYRKICYNRFYNLAIARLLRFALKNSMLSIYKEWRVRYAQ